jgi:inward rectifier potassium channel
MAITEKSVSRTFEAESAANLEPPPQTAESAAESAAERLRRAPSHTVHLGGRRTVVTHGLPRAFWGDVYHYVMTLSWPIFFATVASLFLLLNVFFATIFCLGDAAIANQSPAGFLGAFFFSVETLATVGYGDMHPQTVYGHVVATAEIFVGMTFLALFTGIMFARFSRPRARILFAAVAVVHPVDGKPTLVIRAANARQNVIVDASARLRLIRRERTREGNLLRKLHDLELVREQHPVFVLGWSIMHVIDESSPLYGETAASLAATEGGLIFTLEGVDETTSQSMQSRFNYGHEQIRWQHAYEDTLWTDENGVDHIDYTRFHDTYPVPAE